MRKFYLIVIIIFFCTLNNNAQCPFTGPDTVCVYQPVKLQNYSDSATGHCGISGSKTHQWYYENAIIDTTPYVSPVADLSIKHFTWDVEVVMDKGKYYSFVTACQTQTGYFDSSSLYRQDYDTDITSKPKNTLIYLNPKYALGQGIKLVQDSGIWYGFMMVWADGGCPQRCADLIRLRFNNGIEDTAPTATYMNIPRGIKSNAMKFVNDNGHWCGIIGSNGWFQYIETTNTTNSITVMNFTQGLNADPSTVIYTNYPFNDTTWCVKYFDIYGEEHTEYSGFSGLDIVKENGKWHALAVSRDHGRIKRIDFESDFLDPKFIELGNPGNSLGGATDVTIAHDCDNIMAIVTNGTKNSISLLYFDSTITGTVKGIEYKMDTTFFKRPQAVSNILQSGSTIYALILNSKYSHYYSNWPSDTGTFSLFKVARSGDSHINLKGDIPDTNFIPDSTLYYTKPGKYYISMTTDDDPSKATCHTVFVMQPPGAALGIIPTEACPGALLKAVLPDTVNANKTRYEWTYPGGGKSNTKNPPVTDSGFYSVKLSFGLCNATQILTQKVTITDYPARPKITNNVITDCPANSTKIYLYDLIPQDEIKWYADSALTILVHDTTTTSSISYYQIPPMTKGVYTYYVVRKPKDKETCLHDQSKPLVVTLMLFKPPAPTMTGGGATYCIRDVITPFTASPVMLGVNWYSDSLLTKIVNKGALYDPAPDIDSGNTYSFYATYDSSSTCKSDAGKVTIIVKETPQPTCPDLTECESSITAGSHFTAAGKSGSTIYYYGDSLKFAFIKSGSSPLDFYHSQTKKGIYTYWVTQLFDGCNSLNKKITLTINKTEKPELLMYDTNYYTCLASEVNPLRIQPDINYSKIEWKDSTNNVVGTTSVFAPAIDINKIALYNYKVRQQVNNCWSLYNQVVLSVVNCADVSVSLCSAMPAYDLFNAQTIPVHNHYWQDNDSTTALSGSMIDLKNPGILGEKTFQYYTYRVKTNVDKQLSAGNPKDTTFFTCIGSIDLRTLLRNRDEGGIWHKDDSVISSPAILLKPGSNLYKYYIPVSPNGTCNEDLAIMRINADSTTPVITRCVNKELKPVNAGQNEYVVDDNKYDPIVSDLCNKYKVTYTINGNLQGDSTLMGASLPIGVNQITWIATDSLGQKSNPCYCEFTVAYFVIPNYFTPNGDGINDTWYFSLEKTPGATVKIYNQWGIMVYDSKGKTLIDWDGRNTKGLECPADGYQYLISNGDKMIYKGTVTIIR